VEIKANDVKKLRDTTGAGMMDCKKALMEANGDFTRAEKILKELGLAAAKKRDGRATNEGRIFSKISGNRGILLELTSETDFVARSKEFITLGEKCLSIIEAKKLSSPSPELEACVKDAIGIIKENLTLKQISVIEASDSEILVDYIHGEGKIGVLVKMKVGNPSLKTDEKVKALAFDLALHVAAFAPLYMNTNAVDEAYIKEQEEIFLKQTEKLDKPENVLKGIAKGKLTKHLAEICFMDQPFVKDEKKKVSDVIKNTAKELGTDLAVTDYRYFKLGV
jgi:elongation factor Ts